MNPITVFLTVACLAVGITFTSANAGGVDSLSCVGGASFAGHAGVGGSFNCVEQWSITDDPYLRTVPEASLAQMDKAQAAERDRKWLKRCHPIIERDSYGVARYQYAASGCEYGIGAGRGGYWNESLLGRILFEAFIGTAGAHRVNKSGIPPPTGGYAHATSADHSRCRHR